MNEFRMSINGLACEFNMPPALKTRLVNGQEVAHGLPPHKRVKPFIVDEYPAAVAEGWLSGSDKESSYFLPVKEGYGAWIDFNPCWRHTHHVAIVPSIQKINPLTGQLQETFELQQYKKRCPLHDVDFKQDRFCPECKFKWPAQNYLATTGTPTGALWLDGFRNEEGQVRQWILTAEKIRGVAANLIGDERVFAIGIAFYLSKKEKPKDERPKSPLRGSGDMSDLGKKLQELWEQQKHEKKYPVPPSKPIWIGGTLDDSTWVSNDSDNILIGGSHRPDRRLRLSKSALSGQAMGGEMRCCVDPATRGDKSGAQLQGFEQPVASNEAFACMDFAAEAEVETKLEIGAGATIEQQVYPDPEDLSFWRDEPEGFIYINYADERKVNKIIKAGRRAEKTEGFLTGIPTGN